MLVYRNVYENENVKTKTQIRKEYNVYMCDTRVDTNHSNSLDSIARASSRTDGFANKRQGTILLNIL